MPISFLIEIEFVWGFESRVIGLSRTSPSFFYPPPSVFLGSCAEAIAKNNNFGEKEGVNIIPELSKNILAIGLKPINCFPIKYEDIGRIITIKETSGKLYPNPEDLAGSFDSPARGKTLLLSLDDDAPKIILSIIFKNDYIYFKDEKIVLNSSIFWQIHRLGSKESRVSVNEVKEIKNVEIIKDKNIITTYSFPVFDKLQSVIEIRPEWREEIYINPFEIQKYSEQENPITGYILGKNIIRFKIPILSVGKYENPEYIVGVSGNIVCFKLTEKDLIVGRI